MYVYHTGEIDYFLLEVCLGAISNGLGMRVMQWLRNFDQRLRESMEYALCLNSLGSSSDRMWLHVSKPPENAFIKQILSVCTLSSSFMY